MHTIHWNLLAAEMSCHIARNRCITIVYRRIEFVTWISSINVTWNLSHGYRLSPHRICHVDIVYRHIVIVYCHIVIVYRRIDVVTCSSSHSTTFRATVDYPSIDLLTKRKWRQWLPFVCKNFQPKVSIIA